MSWYITPAEARALARGSASLTNKPVLSNSTETSDAAARSVSPKRSKLQARVVEAISRNYGEATADEIEVLTGLSGNSVRPRIVELREAGVIEDSGRQRPTRLGNKAVVWRLR